MRRTAAGWISMLALVVLALSPAGAQAVPVTIGSPLTASFSSAGAGAASTVANPGLAEAGAVVSSPVNGTVVRWRIADASGGPFYLRILTPVNGNTYTGAGTSEPRLPQDMSTQTFTTNLPIRTPCRFASRITAR